MPATIITGAKNFGRAVIERLFEDEWTVTGCARSDESLAEERALGAGARRVDVTDQKSVLKALRTTADRHGRLELVVNAASPHGTGSEPFGGEPLAKAGAAAFDNWTTPPVHGALSLLSTSARGLLEQGGPATVIQVTGGSARQNRPGRGLWGRWSVRRPRADPGRSARAPRPPHSRCALDRRRPTRLVWSRVARR